MPLSPEYLAQQPDFIAQDAWAHDRMRYLIAWMQNHDGVPALDVVNELAQLAAAYHVNMAELAALKSKKVTFSDDMTLADVVRTAAASSDDDNQPTGEPIKLSSLPGFSEHTPADPGIQAEADPWLVIVRYNGHAWRVWESGRLEHSDHPSRLFEPVADIDMCHGRSLDKFNGRVMQVWFDAHGWRFVIDPSTKTVIRVPLTRDGIVMEGFKAALDIQPEALTWWPG